MNVEGMKRLSDFQWSDYVDRGWHIGHDMMLRSVIEMDNVPFVLKVEIDAPLITQYGVQPLRNMRDFVLFDLPDHISSNNELRWRITQRVEGQDILQRLTINRTLACSDGPQLCEHGDKMSLMRCCGRVEIGTMQSWLRDQYADVIMSQDLDQVAVWVLNVFEGTACAIHHKYRDRPAWLETTTEANAKMGWLSAADSRDMLYNSSDTGAPSE